MQVYMKELREKEKIKKAEEAEIKKWEILNRYKQNDVMKDYDEKKKILDQEKIEVYKKELLEQIVNCHLKL